MRKEFSSFGLIKHLIKCGNYKSLKDACLERETTENFLKSESSGPDTEQVPLGELHRVVPTS